MTDPTQQYKPGDVVNGHRLTDQDGTLVWLPVQADPAPAKKKSRRGLWIGIAAAVALIIIIGNLNRGNDKAEEAVADKPAAVAEAVEEEPAAPAKATIPDVTGMAASTAVSKLRAAGFEVADPADAGAIVTSTTPAKGGIAEEGTTVTLAVEPPKPKLSLEQENALEQAQSYLDYSSFSRQGLIDQMSSEYGSGYPVDVATWAVDNLNVDWNAEAVEQAKSYLEYSSFSRQDLFDQMTSQYGSQFTPEQAEFALAAVGY